MGMYDNIDVADERYDDQLKCWRCTGETFRKGDEVPDIDGNTTYSVRLRAVGEPTPLSGIASSLAGWAKERAVLGTSADDLDVQPRAADTRYITVENRKITSTFADNPLSGSLIYDKWGEPVAR